MKAAGVHPALAPVHRIVVAFSSGHITEDAALEKLRDTGRTADPALLAAAAKAHRHRATLPSWHPGVIAAALELSEALLALAARRGRIPIQMRRVAP